MSVNKKRLKEEYQLNPRPMGVYQIRNATNNKVLIGSALNLPGIINRHKFALNLGQHANKALQADWHDFGSDNFIFEVLDELEPREGLDYDYRADLTFLEELWIEKLQPFGERGYNEKKKSREEMLRQIAQNRPEESEA